MRGHVLLTGLCALLLAVPGRAALFGAAEFARSGPAAVTANWTGMLARARAGCTAPRRVMAAFDTGFARPASGMASGAVSTCEPGRLHDLTAIARAERGRPLAERLAVINFIVNAVPYRDDRSNYGVADYWATLGEFAARGGDCEDYATAKYMLLKLAGVDPAAMRVVVVRDLEEREPHAVLSVAADGRTWILDNQSPALLTDDQVGRYAPVYAVNERGWWLFLPAAK